MDSYLINLDRSTDRRNFFMRQASEFGIQVHRISAVDGKQLSDTQLASMTRPEYHFHPLNAGEIGLWQSHKDAWKRLVASGQPHAAVFEDDAVLSPVIAETFARIDESNAEYDVIKLETTLRKIVCNREFQSLGRDTLSELKTWHGGTAGYVISAACAQRLLEQHERVADPIDQVLFNPASPACRNLRVLQISPATCIQMDILDKDRDPAFATTLGRDLHKRRLFKHGVWADTRRLFRKQVESVRRNILARTGNHMMLIVPFHRTASSKAAA